MARTSNAASVRDVVVGQAKIVCDAIALRGTSPLIESGQIRKQVAAGLTVENTWMIATLYQQGSERLTITENTLRRWRNTRSGISMNILSGIILALLSVAILSMRMQRPPHECGYPYGSSPDSRRFHGRLCARQFSSQMMNQRFDPPSSNG